jgi:aspartyl-tRNA(Asn)/glutamyl-tRNA(Gln) amidotransferase subunit B
MMSEPVTYQPSIGLEVHVQLRTATKIWCGCPNRYGNSPNTDICPVCMGYPGALPVLNARAVELTVRTGLLLGCDINRYSKWDRKNYFYPDMPKNFQISQYDLPLCVGGGLEIEVEGEKKRISLTRIHLEEDVAKNTHLPGRSVIDFNRAGTPLMEIVTEPDLSTADEAMAFLLALKEMLSYGEISDCNLEEGNIRCDINCSVRPAGATELGTKAEIKNMNTFKGVHRALSYEIKRQSTEVQRGGEIVQETRRWDDAGGVTQSMRTKEYAHDYRYFPEPDLVPVRLADETIESIRSELPEMPAVRRIRFVESYGLPEYDAGVLVAEKDVADFYESVAQRCGNYKAISNWIMTELLRALSETGRRLPDSSITPENLAALIGLVDDKKVNMAGAKEVFQVLFEEGGDPAAIVDAKGLSQVSDEGEIEAFVDQAIQENEKSANDVREGKDKALQYLMGQVMRLSRGKANPQVVLSLLREKLQN